MACPGRRNFLWFLSVVVLISSSTRAQPGRFDVIAQNAGVASMHTVVTHFSNAIFLDRTNIGPSQINLAGGGCRDNPDDRTLKHDCTAHSVMFDYFSGASRALSIYSDTWCSSGQFLPNGTLLQTGGDFDGFFKVRYMTPCPNGGTCDWQESKTEFLHSGRWYASNQLLPDGRVIVVGGRSAFSYEFIPDRGAGQFELPFLKETNDPTFNNLYPFLHLLPDNNLFVFANRDSILLNYFTNTVLRRYPTLPGEPRNYPSAGSSVMLPLDSANSFSNAEILVCGGSNKDAYAYPAGQLPASQTCGRMVATSGDPNWNILNMPTRRNMGDMVLLPTGQVLIINGAQSGSQGWGYASSPCLNPVIFDPVSSKFETQAASTIPRMYHSTANLLPDGRVLVAGSNTHEYYTFTGEFPTELRVEAFSPAYLDPANDWQRPKLVNYPGVINYGMPFSVDVSLPGNLTGDIELTLLSAPFTTHSFSQGQRQLKLAVSTPLRANGNTFTVKSSAPPSAVIAPPSFYMLVPLHNGIPGTATWVMVTY
ncbi:hypothetical protein SELMODRAFT_89852 [Selaginella moellendorffii]|uniref:Glyoxal oxidase n=1 Tax=Selaginella moellendorffii TaxID=88036 RepID=D8RAW4_SELML|nr:aldehyde oxidase GLOX [Selaginella moellendorffii]EFJ30699.1 hypothetical protein SELMODRAFT_89852 [Selaginella moellendorffii]|eukprot:XP_002968445.1 aldehyde oxidase GLOX [Selaginella moellendorffii]